LLEVLIAFAIVAVSLAALMRATGFGIAAVHTSSRYEDALSRARSHLAGLSAGVETLPDARAGDDGDGFRWRLDVRPYELPRVATTGPAPAATPMLYRVAVTISWTEGATTHSVTLTSNRLGMLHR
jgi:general secretion pathway protein I